MSFLRRLSVHWIRLIALINLWVLPWYTIYKQAIFSNMPSFDISEQRQSTEQVPIFFNVFVRQKSDKRRVKRIVRSQLSNMQSEHRAFVHVIGVPLNNLNATTLGFHEEGSEMVTLHSLWEYCSVNNDAKVVYLHSKGSYHHTPENEALRVFLTEGSLSRECLELPETCNVCASRVSPVPHPHIPGNMWLARCDYIQKLIDPNLFEDRMETVEKRYEPYGPFCIGQDRYAAEHWVLSHPSSQPCDLSTDSNFTWNYFNIPSRDFEKLLAPAPRFDLDVYHKGLCKDSGASSLERIEEYMHLYNETPSGDWWGTGYFHDNQIDTQLT
jgi:hypothetical protein